MSWRLAPLRTIEMGAPRPSTRRFIFSPSLPLSVGLLPVLWPPKGAAQCLESIACHFQEIPPHSLASYSVILFISFSKTPICLHFWKRSWTTLEETPNQSRWRAFHFHPVQRARTYLGVDDGPIRSPRPAAFGSHLPVVFGQALLEFPPQRARKVKVVHASCYGSLSHKMHLL